MTAEDRAVESLAALLIDTCGDCKDDSEREDHRDDAEAFVARWLHGGSA